MKEDPVKARYRRLVTNRHFELAVFLVIVYSCSLMVLADPNKDETEQPKWLQVSVWCVSAIFVVEMILKLLAFGPERYFRDAWNWIDFAVVCEGIISAVLAIIKLAAPHLKLDAGTIRILATFRALRPLRSAQFLPPVRLLIQTFLGSFSETGALCIVMLIIIYIAAGVGQVFFQNQLSYRCFSDSGVSYNEQLFCGSSGDSFACPANYTCRDSGSNPNLGVTSFDNLAEGLITTFQISSTKGWINVTFYLQDGYSKFAWPFTLALLFLTNCVLLNLFPAILTTKFYGVLMAYNNMMEQKKKDQEALRKRLGGGAKEELANPSGEEDDDDMEMDLNAEDPEGKADFRKILQRFEDAEKEDMKMIAKSLKKDGADSHDPLLSNGRKKLPLLAPSCLFCADWRAAIANEGGTFMKVIYTCILLNCFALAIDQYPEEGWRVQLVYLANVIFTSIFILEVVLKFLVFGPVGFAMDWWNLFDFVVTVLTTVSLFIRAMKLVVVLRVFRLAKLLTLARASRMKQAFTSSSVLDPIMDLPRIMNVLNSTLSFAFYLAFLLVIFTFIFAVVGRSYFWGTLNVPEFGSFAMSVITMFRIISGDGWDELVFESVAQGGNSYALFYIVWMVLSRWFILSFVTAMIIYYVDLDGREYLAYVARSTTISVCKMEAALTRVYKRICFTAYKEALEGGAKSHNKVELMEEPEEEKAVHPLLALFISDKTLGVLDTGHPIRRFADWMIDLPAFQNFVLVMIMAGAVTMTIQLDVTAQGRTLPSYLDHGFSYLDWCITLVFVFELLLFAIGRGIFSPKDAYLRGGMSNIVDFCITVTSVANTAVEITSGDSSGQNLAGLVKILRVLRVFRIIRLATRSKVTRLILASFMTAGKAVAAVVGIVSVCVVVFAILGIQLFAGKFRHCSNPLFPIGGYHNRAYNGFPDGCTDSWVGTELSFDNFGRALLSSVVCFSLDGWSDLLASAVNAWGVGRQPDTIPHQIHEPWMALYFVVYDAIIYLVTPLFVGVLYGAFLYSIYVDGNLKKRVPSIKDAEWAIYRMKLSFIVPIQVPSRPINWRRSFYDVITSVRYKVFIGLVVVVHCALRVGFFADEMTDFWESSNPSAHIFDNVGTAFNLFAIIVYLIDTFLLRLLGLGLRGITVSVLDKLDVVVTIVMVAQLAAACQGKLQALDPHWQQCIDAITVLRVFKLLSSMTRTRQMFGVVVHALQGVSSICVLILCVVYIYAVFGVIAFSSIHIFPDDPWMSRHYRFDSVSGTMLVLASVVTGDDWTTPMTEMAAHVPPEWKWAVYVYFCSLLIACKFIFFNMFLLVILQQYEIHCEDKTGLAMGQVREFRRAWQIFDERGSGRMMLKHVPLLLRRLGEPLGTSRRMPLADATRTAQKLCYLSTLTELRRLADEVVLDRAEAMKDPKKRQILAIVDHDKAFLESPEGGSGSIRTLEDLAWASTPRDLRSPDYASQKVTFKEVIITSHQNAIFRPQLKDEEEYRVRRRRAKEFAGLLKEGVWGLWSKARFGEESREVQALNYLVTMQRYSSSSYRQRLPVTIAAAFESWSRRVESAAYDYLLHVEGKLILMACEEQLRQAKEQSRMMHAVVGENVEDADFYQQDMDELRKLADALDKTLKQIVELRSHYVDVIWELEDPPVETIQQFQVPQASINAVALTADANLLFIGDSDGCVKVFRRKDPVVADPDMSTSAAVVLASAKPTSAPKYKYVYVSEVTQETPVLAITVAADGRRFYTAGKDNFIRAWARESQMAGGGGGKSGAPKKKKVYAEFVLKEIMQGHKGEIYAMEFYHPNFLFSAGQDGFLRMWALPCISTIKDCAVPNIKSLLGGRPMLFCLTIFEDPDEDLDGTYVATGGSDGILSCFMFRTDTHWTVNSDWRPMLTIEAFNGRAVTAVAFAWRRIYTAGSDGSLRVWDLEFAFDPVSKAKAGIKGLSLVVSMPCHAAPVSSLAVVGGVLYSASHDMSIVPWLEPTREPDAKDLAKYKTVQGMLGGMIFHTDAITGMVGNGKVMVTVDVRGGVVVRAPVVTKEKIKTGVRKQKGGGGHNRRATHEKAEANQVAKSRKSVLELARAMVERYPALEGSFEGQPDFINEQFIMSLDPTREDDPQAAQHPKTFLALLLHHTFPPRVVGQPGSNRPANAITASVTPPPAEAAGATSYGESFALTPRTPDEGAVDVSDVQLSEQK